MKWFATRPALVLLASAVLLSFAPLGVLAHGDDAHACESNDSVTHGAGCTAAGMSVNMTGAEIALPEAEYAPTYFSHPDHRALVFSHMALMLLAWVVILPVAVMFSLARSRYTLVSQMAFLCANACGLLVGIFYNARTPNLYPNNAHHKLGWVVTWVAAAQVLVGLLAKLDDAFGSRRRRSGSGAGAEPGRSEEQQSFIPVSTAAMAEHNSFALSKPHRYSHDSGHGTEPGTEPLQSPRSSGSGSSRRPAAGSPLPPTRLREKEHGQRHNRHNRHDGDDGDDEVEIALLDEGLEAQLPPRSRDSGTVHGLARRMADKVSASAWKVLLFGYNFVDRMILLLAFINLCTGIVTYGRLFEGPMIFTGLAHWIKGGVFFWFGIFTLGRWAGSFGDLGWAWNIRPGRPGREWTPSAEFCESFLIFFYGSTNIFLEHLASWGGEWAAEDLEHISITVLFIGGGLCGMLIESSRIRNLLNTTVIDAAAEALTRRRGTAASFSPSSSSTHTDDVPGGEEEGEEAGEKEGDEHVRRRLHHPQHDGAEALQAPATYGFSINPLPALVLILLGFIMSSHAQPSMIGTMLHKQWGDLLAGACLARVGTYALIFLRPPRSVLPSRPPTELLASFGLIATGIIFMASSKDTVKAMVHYKLDAMFMYTVTMGFVGLIMAWTILLLALKGWAVRSEAGRFSERSRVGVW